MRVFQPFDTFHFQLHIVQQAKNDRKITRLKGINYCVDKQVDAEDINCFPSE